MRVPVPNEPGEMRCLVAILYGSVVLFKQKLPLVAYLCRGSFGQCREGKGYCLCKASVHCMCLSRCARAAGNQADVIASVSGYAGCLFGATPQ